MASVGVCGDEGLPSSASPGSMPRTSTSVAAPARRLNVRITRLLCGAARMGHGAMQRIADLLRVFPDVTGLDVVLVRLPVLPPLGQLCRGQLHIQRAGFGVDLDDVAIAEERDRAADCGLRTDMADAEAARCAGEPSVGDQGDLAAHALAI